MSRRFALRALMLCAGLASASLSTWAQPTDTWPTRPVKLVVPFPAGGASDLIGRVMAEELTKALGQPVVVDNRAGAGGAIGTTFVAKAPADGYTLLLSGIGTNAVNHAFNDRIGYDSLKDFVHITQAVEGPTVLVANTAYPARTLQELVADGKAHPTKLSYALTPASSGHLAMEMLKQVASECPRGSAPANCKPLFMVGIPYRGASPALTDVIGGQVPFMFVNQDTALPFVRSGKLRAIAVSSLKRNPLYPDVPTVAESGYPGFSAVAWIGLSAPRAVPAPIVERIGSSLRRALNSPQVKEKLESTGYVVVASEPAAYASLVESEIAKWTKLVKAQGIKPE